LHSCRFTAPSIVNAITFFKSAHHFDQRASAGLLLWLSIAGRPCGALSGSRSFLTALLIAMMRGVHERVTTAHSRLPAWIREVTDDRRGMRTLVAVSFAILAAGLDPPLLDPGMPSVRAALRAEPGLQSLLSLSTEVQAAFLLLGGVVADRWRTKRTLQLGLGLLIFAEVVAVIGGSGPLLIASRFIGWAASGVVIPFSIGAVAVVYLGTARATALGLVYAVMGLGTALAPALAVSGGTAGPRWPAFAVCAVAAAVAIVVVERFQPDLPINKGWPVAAILATVSLGVGIVAIVSAAFQIGDLGDPLRFGSLGFGLLAVLISLALRRRAESQDMTMRFDYRPLGAAIFAGLVVGFSQAAPVLQVPLYWQLIQGMAPIVATVAIAPFIVGLFVAGPASGWLLQRVSPRRLIAGGTIAIGIADLIIAAVLDVSTPYILFVLPLSMIGAGFVVATTVRTAVIFASMPSRLPSLAAGINSASLGVGSRIGVVIATVVLSRVALDFYATHLVNVDPTTAAAAVAEFRALLTVIGLPGYTSLISGLDAPTFSAYGAAAVEGLRLVEAISGVVAISGGVFVYFAMGPRSPLVTVFDMAEERESLPSVNSA